MKICSKCKSMKDEADFSKNAAAPDGLQYHCKECAKEISAKWYNNNRHRAKITRKIWSEAKRDRRKETNRLWWSLNRERAKELAANWRTNNRGRANALNKKYKAKKMNATPSWANLVAIQCKYQVAAMLNREGLIKYHVDHIIPLQGKNVCGLHTSENLRVITAQENQIKGNRYAL